ncbi:CBS domain-containing protein [Nocardia mexicana]|uniref:BON domain-containing protein n=1 Tax=Nocardia mexicana TaxID=279262 RepID=A0A370H550_9NOCA|nr:CBS domain-containing protein [Nocardia mexicana]RDI51147.1 BON domain-containing protein [Nocardia mexicana]
MMLHKTVADVMTRDVVSVRVDTPFKHVIRTLAEHDVSGVPVLDRKRYVVGMISEADLLDRQAYLGGGRRAIAWSVLRRREFARKRDARTAADLMSTPAVTVDVDARVTAAAAVLARGGVKRAAVVDDRGVLVGIVSRKDLLSVYLRSDAELADEIRTEVLEKAVWLAPAEATVEVRNGVVTLRGVVEQRGTIGIVTALTDVVDGVVEVHNEIVADTARDLMHHGVRTVAEGVSVAEAARRMRDFGVGALPVQDSFGVPIGIVTDRDLAVKCVAAGLNPQQTAVGSVATDPLVTADADSPVAHVLDVMRRHRIHRLPVLEDNRLIGIVTEADLARSLPPRLCGEQAKALNAQARNEVRATD